MPGRFKPPVSLLAEEIKVFRVRKGLSQKAFAEMCGCSEDCIGRIENGHNPRWDTIVMIAKAMGVSPHDLIRGVRK